MITYEHNSKREEILKQLWDDEVSYLSDKEIQQMAYQQFKRDLKTYTTETLTEHAVDIKR